MRGHLLWQKTDEIYINVSVRQNLGAVLCGDNEGSIWIYDLDPYLDDLHSSSRKRFHVKPIKVKQIVIKDVLYIIFYDKMILRS